MAEEKVMEVVRHLPLTKKSCPQCGKEFWGQPARKFCSTACRNRAAYWRAPEERRERRRKQYQAEKDAAKK